MGTRLVKRNAGLLSIALDALEQKPIDPQVLRRSDFRTRNSAQH